jgi:RNA polymerase sigma-70 factor (ECF subfamily)
VSPDHASFAIRQASIRASLLVATAGFRSDDWEDLRQEMILDCLRRSPKFDPSRGDWQGFVRGVIRNHATVLVTRRHRSLQREVLAEDLSYKEPRTADDRADHLGAGHKHEIEPGLQMSIDVQRVLSGLPPQLQNLARLLSESPMLEAGAKTGKSRSRVYQMTRQLRDAFVRAGFRTPFARKSAVKRRSNSRTEVKRRGNERV